MKKEFHAKIVGHELFVPDPKTPLREAVKVKLLVSSLEPAMGKPAKGMLVIEESELPGFALRQHLRITVEDSQQELPLTRRRGTKEEQAQLGIVPPAGGRKRNGAPEITH